MMTIDEAIEQAREVASRKFDDKVRCIKCSEFHEQIAEWLEELKAIKSNWSYVQGNKAGQKIGYKNAIDDFAKRLATYLGVENATKYGNKNAEQQRNSYDTLMKYEIADAIDDVAEQLKAGN